MVVVATQGECTGATLTKHLKNFPGVDFITKQKVCKQLKHLGIYVREAEEERDTVVVKIQGVM